MNARTRSQHARRIVAVAIVCVAAAPFARSNDRRHLPQYDGAMVELGRELFTHQWTANDPLAHGDGLGPVFNEVSCVACHAEPGIGGGGPVEKSAVLFDVRKLVHITREVHQPCTQVTHVEVAVPTAATLQHGGIHAKAVSPEFQESRELLSMAFEHEEDRQIEVSRRNSIALFGIGLIDAIPDSAILHHEGRGSIFGAIAQLGTALSSPPKTAHGEAAGASNANLATLFANDLVHGRVYRLADGRIGRFGWRSDFATLQEFTEAACANELGLGNPGHDQPVPWTKSDYEAPARDLTRQQCEAISAFLRSLPRPVEELPDDSDARSVAIHGKEVFTAVGCANCHAPTLGKVEGLYSDLLLHDMADPRTGPYGVPLVREVEPSELARPSATEWRTPPLWGVADSAPYMHDGSAYSLDAAIKAHRGAARGVREQFDKLPTEDRESVIAFLKTLRAPAAARRDSGAVASNR